MTWVKPPEGAKTKRATFRDRSPPRSKTPAWLAVPRDARRLAEAKSLLPAAAVASLYPEENKTAPTIDLRTDASSIPPLDVLPLKMLSRPPPRGLEADAPSDQVFDPGQLFDRDRKYEYDRALLALDKAIEDLATLRRRILQCTEEQLVELSTAIAKKVIGRELGADRAAILGLAQEGIEALGARDTVTVKLGQFDDDAQLEGFVARLRARGLTCEIVQDSTLGPGDCIVETELGRVDESLQARLSNVAHTLLTSLHKTESENP